MYNDTKGSCHKIFIFCQAAGDIKYTFDLVEKYKDQNVNVKVFLPPNQPCIEYVKDKIGSVAIVLPDYPNYSLKKIWRILITKMIIENVNSKYFKGINDATVYFFSQEFDWYSLSFIYGLFKQGCKIIHYEHYYHQPSPVLNLGLKDRIILQTMRFMTGSPFQYCRLGGQKGKSQKIPQLSLNELLIEKIPAKYEDYILHKYSCSLENEGEKILWIDSPSVGYTEDYERKVRQILDLITKTGLTIFVKPHPRLPLHPLFNDFAFKILEKKIPGEFIDFRTFECVFGLYSSLLKTSANHVETYSLMNTLQWKDSHARDYIFNSLTHPGKNVEFLDTLSSLQNLLNNVKIK